MLRTGSARWQVKPQRECGSCCRSSPCGLPCLLLELPRGFGRSFEPPCSAGRSSAPLRWHCRGFAIKCWEKSVCSSFRFQAFWNLPNV